MIRALLSVLPRSSCVSWSPQAKSPLAALSPAKGREALLREPPAQRITSGKCPELSWSSSMKEAKKCSRILPPQWISPELSNFSKRKVLVTERSEPLRAGDFVLRTTSLRSWTAQGSATLDPEKNARAFFRNIRRGSRGGKGKFPSQPES